MPEKHLLGNKQLESTLKTKKVLLVKFIMNLKKRICRNTQICFEFCFGNFSETIGAKNFVILCRIDFFDAFKGNIFDLRSYRELVFVFFRTAR